MINEGLPVVKFFSLFSFDSVILMKQEDFEQSFFA
jgi:hypothetical protein